MIKFIGEKENGTVIEFLLLPRKDVSRYQFVNLTRGHICPCEFNTIEDAVEDVKKYPYKSLLMISTDERLSHVIQRIK